MKKRCILALLLCFSLLLAGLAGCGAQTDSGPSPAAESSAEAAPEAAAAPEEAPVAPEPETAGAESATEESTEEPAAEPEEVLPEITYPLTDTPETLSMYCLACNFMGPLSSVSMEWDDFDCYKELEALTGVHIDFQAASFESYLTSFNIYIASGDIADLVINIGSRYVGGTTAALEDGVITELTPYLQEYAPDYYRMINEDDQLREAAYNREDQVLDFIAAYDRPGMKNGSIVRGDWLDQLHLEIQNFSDLYTYLSAAKNRFGAEVPVCMTKTSSEFSSAFGFKGYGVGNGNPNFYVVDGEVRTALNRPEYRDYLREMHKWYEEGLLYKDFATTSFDPHDNTLNQMIYNGQTAIWATQLEGLDDYEASSPDPEFISRPIPSITLDGGPDHTTAPEYVITDSDICVSANCGNVPLAVSWMNYWYTEDGIRMYNYGPEGEAWHFEGDTVVLEDFVLNNEFGVDMSSFLRMYCPYGSFVGIYLRSRLTDYCSQLQLDATRIWSESVDGAYVIPTGVTVDAASNEELAAKAADLTTYADTCIPKFIMGDMDIETEWDSYIDTLESMGIADIIQIEQDAYDAYIG